MWKIVIGISLVLVTMASCRSTKKIGTAIAKKDTTQIPTMVADARLDSMNFIKSTLQGMAANQINFTTFNAKVNIDYRDAAGKNYDVNAVVRMYKDSAIWISANAILGIEAIRALITKDSVKILDKLNKTYTARRVDYLQEVTKLPLDLVSIQNLLLGNPVFLDSNVVSYYRTGDAIALLSIGQWFKNLLTINGSDKLLLRSRLDDVDITRSRAADLTYTDYENKKGFPFATKRRILITEKKTLDIKMDFKQYDFNGEVSFPFSIPKNYTTN
jgi:hypothetical protein